MQHDHRELAKELLTEHNKQSEDRVQHFFEEVLQLYVKVRLNPFYQEGHPIQSQAFDAKVRAIAKRHL